MAVWPREDTPEWMMADGWIGWIGNSYSRRTKQHFNCEVKCGFGGSTLGDVGGCGGPDAALGL